MLCDADTDTCVTEQVLAGALHTYRAGCQPDGLRARHAPAAVRARRGRRAWLLLRAPPDLRVVGLDRRRASLRPFLAAVLTEIYLRNVCSCHEMLRRNGGRLGHVPAEAGVPKWDSMLSVARAVSYDAGLSTQGDFAGMLRFYPLPTLATLRQRLLVDEPDAWSSAGGAAGELLMRP
jgi:hypothetical protein